MKNKGYFSFLNHSYFLIRVVRWGKWIHKDWLEQYSLFSERQINHCHRNCLDNFHGDLHVKIRRDFRFYC